MLSNPTLIGVLPLPLDRNSKATEPIALVGRETEPIEVPREYQGRDFRDTVRSLEP